MAAPASAGARFRQRKISVRQSLNVYKLQEIPDLEAETQRNVHEIESGVDKAEETEEHLQKVILAAEAAVNGKKVDQVYIPTPDASQHWGQASKYYTGKFIEPSSYVKFSATVEDTAGCLYCLDEVDEEFLQDLNKEFSKNPLSELEFETICDRYESVIEQKQPFLSIDPESIYSYEEVKEFSLQTDDNVVKDVTRSLEQELNIHPFVTLFDNQEIQPPRELKVLLKHYGEKVYNHWKLRRISRLGKPVFPTLKFEDPSDKNNENDPYVCFRRREFRQARKTRRTDAQGSERLRRLHLELRSVRELVLNCAQREVKRLEALKVEKSIFDLRCQVKTLKRELNIPGEEEDLIAHKKKKVIPPEPKREDKDKGKIGRPKLHELNPNQDISVKHEDQKRGHVNPVQAQPYVKLPASKIPDIDLVTVQAVLNEKESAITRAVYEKLKTRKELDRGWINLTDDANNPLFEIEQPSVHLAEKNHIPFSSISTSLYEVKAANYVDAHISDAISHKRVLPGTTSFRASNGEIVDPSVPEYYQLISNPPSSLSAPLMQLRKRVGRGGVTYIDRKFKRSFDEMDEFLNFSEDEDVSDSPSEDTNVDESLTTENGPLAKKACIKNVYDSKSDSLARLKSRWLFDNEISDNVIIDPSRLNNISSQTQSIRFGSMILTKSLQNLQQQHRNYLMQQQQQAQQLLQQQQSVQSKNGVNGNAVSSTNGNTKVKSSISEKPAGSGHSSVSSTPLKRQKSTAKSGMAPSSSQNSSVSANSTVASAKTLGTNVKTISTS